MKTKEDRVRGLLVSLLACVGLFYLLSFTPRLVSFLVSSLPKIKVHLAVYFWSYLFFVGVGVGTLVLMLLVVGVIGSIKSARDRHQKLVCSPCAVCGKPVGAGFYTIPGTGGDPDCRQCGGSGTVNDFDESGSWSDPCRSCSIYYPDFTVCRVCYVAATSYKAFGIKPVRRPNG